MEQHCCYKQGGQRNERESFSALGTTEHLQACSEMPTSELLLLGEICISVLHKPLYFEFYDLQLSLIYIEKANTLLLLSEVTRELFPLPLNPYSGPRCPSKQHLSENN